VCGKIKDFKDELGQLDAESDWTSEDIED